MFYISTAISLATFTCLVTWLAFFTTQPNRTQKETVKRLCNAHLLLDEVEVQRRPKTTWERRQSLVPNTHKRQKLTVQRAGSCSNRLTLTQNTPNWRVAVTAVRPHKVCRLQTETTVVERNADCRSSLRKECFIYAVNFTRFCSNRIYMKRRF